MRRVAPTWLACALALFGCESHPLVLFRIDAGARDAGFTNPNPTGTHVRAGEFHSCALRDGTMSCWGGYDLAEYRSPPFPSDIHEAPIAIAGARDLVLLETGLASTCALGSDGAVYCVGRNDDGQLGTGDTSPRDTLTLAPIVPSSSLSLTHTTSCAITVDGQLYCWGNNGEAQLPNASESIVTRPQLAVPSLRFTEVSAGQGHVCAIEAGGVLYCWGRNDHGECGVGLGVERIAAPAQVAPGMRFVHVSAGQNGTCAIAFDHTLYCWGAGRDVSDVGPVPWESYGLLSPFSGATDPVIVRGHLEDCSDPACFVVERPLQVGVEDDWLTIDAATFHGCGLRESGLYCWGRGQEGQLGLGTIASQASPMQVAADLDVLEVSTGRFHTCLVDRAQRILCTGKNEFGEVGVGDVTLRSSFTEVTLVQ